MKKNSLLSFLVIILLLIAIAIRGGVQKEKAPEAKGKPAYSISEIREFFPDAASFSKNKNGSISVKNSKQKEIATLLCSEDFNIHNIGYAGEVPLLIAINNKHVIEGVFLMKNQETPGFIKRIKKKKLFEAWNGFPLDTSLVTMHIDAISGATYSSSAIIKTVKETTATFLKTDSKSLKINWLTILRLTLTFILLALSLNMLFRKKLRKYYWYYLFIVFIVFGIWLKQMLSLGLLHTWLTQGISIQHNIELITILLLSIIMSLLGHRKYYCNYLCPMGAMQMLISKVSPFKKRNLRLKISVITLRNIYLTFIWVTLIFGFTLPLFEMEPFPAFAFSTASTIMLCAGVLIVILSLFFNRPWCQLCPTGCLLDSVPTVKSKK